MTLVSVLWIGSVIGAIAKVLTPGRDPIGFIVTMALGIAGSLLATFADRISGLHDAGVAAGLSVSGAVIAPLVFRLICSTTAARKRNISNPPSSPVAMKARGSRFPAAY